MPKYLDMGVSLSIVIPTYNRRERTLETLRALRENVGVSYELIVVDNASEDGTADTLRAQNAPELCLIELSENRNAAARNIGIEAAKSPYLMMLDDDSVPHEGASSLALEVLKQKSSIGVVAGRIRLVNQLRRDESAGGLHTFIGCGAVFRTKELKVLGGYPENLGYGAEEYEVSAKYLNAGLEVQGFQNIQFDHYHAAGARNRPRQIGLLARNTLAFYTRWLSEKDSARICEWVGARYALIGRQQDCEDTVLLYIQKGMDQRKQLIAAGQIALGTRATCQKIAPKLFLKERLAPLCDKYGTAPVLVGLTREIGLFSDTLKELGMPASKIIDDSFSDFSEDFDGLQLCSWKDQKNVREGSWYLAATTSPGCADVMRAKIPKNLESLEVLVGWDQMPIALKSPAV